MFLPILCYLVNVFLCGLRIPVSPFPCIRNDRYKCGRLFPTLRVICADPTPCQPSVSLSCVQSTYQLMDKSVEVESAGSPTFSMHNCVSCYYNTIVSSLHTCNTFKGWNPPDKEPLPRISLLTILLYWFRTTLNASPSAFPAANGAISSLREHCGLPCSLCVSLCTLRVLPSMYDNYP